MRKIRLAIFTARNLATSSDCSPETIQNIVNILDPDRYSIDIILIDSVIPPHLQVTEDKLLNLPMYVPFDQVFSHQNISNVLALEALTLGQIKDSYDMAIVAIYNDFGEDGKLLGLLDTIGIPYLSPSLKVSAVCYDKSFARDLITQHGGLVPPGFLVHKDRYLLADVDKRIVEMIGYPAVIKPASSGNSYGTTLIRSSVDIDKAVGQAFTFSNELLVEKLIDGQEFTVGVMGSYLNPTALPVVQISSHKEFFDYEAKYTQGQASEICPAPITDELVTKLKAATLRAYTAVKGDSHARIDMIYGDDTNVYILDINTFPGLNSASLFPKELKAAGSSLAKFMDEQIRMKVGR